MEPTWKAVRSELMRALRQAPRLYFAPLVGAVRYSRIVVHQVARENRRSHGASISRGVSVQPTWRAVWEEVLRAFRQAPRLYFAPVVGAVLHSRVVVRRIARENRSAHEE